MESNSGIAGSSLSSSLTPAEQRVWVLNQLENSSGRYSRVFGIILDGYLDYPSFYWALYALSTRHPSLRTIFPDDAGKPFRQVLNANYLTHVTPITDLTDVEQAEEVLARIIVEEKNKPFEPANLPLFRYQLLKTGDRRHICLFHLHMLAGDDASREVLQTDFCRYYERAESGMSEDVSETDDGDTNPDLAELERAEAYWQHRLTKPIMALPLPYDYAPGSRAMAAGTVRVALESTVTTALQQLSVDISTVLLAVYKVFLAKLCNCLEVAVGLPVTGRSTHQTAQRIGLLENLLVLNSAPAPDQTFRSFLAEVRQTIAKAFENQQYPYAELVKWLAPAGAPDPINVQFVVEDKAPSAMTAGTLSVTSLPVSDGGIRCDLMLKAALAEDGLVVEFQYNPARFLRTTVEQLATGFERIAKLVTAAPDVRIGVIDLLNETEKERVLQYSGYFIERRQRDTTVLSAFMMQVQCGADRVALAYDGIGLTYGELDRQANRVAHVLRESHGVQPGQPVALVGENTLLRVSAMLGILKAGAVCVPIDPALPRETIDHIITDSMAVLVLAAGEVPAYLPYTHLVIFAGALTDGDITSPNPVLQPSDLSFLLYPTEKTDQPVGVKVSHANMTNLSEWMQRRLQLGDQDCLLVFDDAHGPVEVIQWLGPLCNGTPIVMHRRGAALNNLNSYVGHDDLSMDFSLFFFANYNVRNDDKYRLLLDAVKYADGTGFKGVWTPERHFHEFGALFPNPSVTSAALAMVTRHLKLRSGSVVSPLHDAIRLAEEWAVVDNLSGGRVELSFAPGWNINDFALAPDHYTERHQVMTQQIDEVKGLWRGESVKRINGLGKEVEIRTFPAPTQSELPVWITAAGNENTFIAAGETGANVLTHLLGQDIHDLARKIGLYREARQRNGYNEGKVALMLHTYVGDDIEAVERIVEKPFTEYLKSAVGLSKILYEEAGLKEQDIPEEDKEIMLRHSFRRYYQTAALIGTPATCAEMIKKLKGIGVDEVACLIDFGIEQKTVMEGLQRLRSLRELFVDYRQRVHSPVTILMADQEQAADIGRSTGSDKFLKSIRLLLLRGKDVSAPIFEWTSNAQLLQGYEFAETTTIAACYAPDGAAITLSAADHVGSLYLLDKALQLVPVGTEGELYVGGDGVSPGYWQQPGLTAERFAPNPIRPEETLFRTGDTGRWLPDGQLLITRRAEVSVYPTGINTGEPATETEVRLVAMWSDLLPVGRNLSDVDLSFFAAGGDSLDAIRLRCNIVETFRVPMELSEIYANKSIRSLARAIEGKGVPRLALIPATAIKEEYPVSFVQEWFYQWLMAHPISPLQMVWGAYGMGSDAYRLQHALQKLAERHEMLRTGFSLDDQRLRQQIREHVVIELLLLDSNDYPTVEAAIAHMSHPFDLSAPPLLRCALWRHSGGDLFLIAASRLVCDKTSLYELVQEITAVYAGKKLRPLELRYVDFASWQQAPTQALEQLRRYWTDKLTGTSPIVDLPVVNNREGFEDHRLEQHVLEIGGEPYHRYKQLGQSSDTSSIAGLLAAYYILLAKITGQTDIVIGAAVSDRRQAAIRGVIGPFDRILPLRVQVREQVSGYRFVAEVENQYRQVLVNQAFPCEQLWSAIHRDTSGKVSNLYFLFKGGVNDAPGASLTDRSDPRSLYEFGLEIHENADRLVLHFVYDDQLYSRDTVALIAEYYRNIFLVLLENTHVSIEDIELESSLEEI